MQSLFDPSSTLLWYIYGTLLVLSLILGVLSALELYKREIFWTAPAAGVSAAAAGVMVFYIAVLDQYLSLNLEFMHVAAAVFWSGVCFSFTFGILGLTQIGRLKNPQGQGRRYAWSAMCFAFILQFFIVHAAAANIIAAFPHESLKTLEKKLKEAELRPPTPAGSQAGSGDSANGQVKDGYKEFPELNFKFKIPAIPWNEINLKNFNPHAALSYMRQNPTQTVMISVEQGIAIDENKVASVADLAFQATRSKILDLKILSSQELKINGMKGYRMTLEGTVAGASARYIWWIYVKNGFYYQLTFYQPAEKPEAELEEAFKQLMPGFQILDPQKNAGTQSSSFDKDFVSPLFGYRMKVEKSSWMPWVGLEQSISQAEFGMTRAEADFCVIPIGLFGVNPDVELLSEAMLRKLKLDFRVIPAAGFKKVSEAGYEGQRIDYENHDQDHTLFRIQTLKGKDRAYLLIAAQNLNQTKRNEGVLADAHKRFEIEKKQKPLTQKDLGEKEKKGSADFYTEIGQILYERGNPSQSVDYFKSAHALHPDGIAFENLIGVLIVLERYQEAQDLLKQHAGRYPASDALPLFEARVLFEVGKTEEALKKYKELLASAKHPAQVLQAYSNALWQLGRRDEAMQMMREQNADRSSDIETRLNYIHLLINNGEIDRALEELRKLRQEFPYNDQVRKTLFETLQANNRDEEAVQLGKEEIQQGRGNYQTYMHQALSEMQLNHYKDAHDSFTKAAEMQPTDSTVREYLKQLESLLGYGNLDEVQKPVLPVEIPSEAIAVPKNSKWVNPFKGNPSYYVNLVTALFFEPGKAFRRSDYRLIKIANEHDLRAFSEFQLNYDSMREQIFVNKLEVRNEKGEVTGELDSSKFYIVDDSDAGYASHDKVLHVPVPGVEVGATIELLYSRESKTPDDEMPYKEIIFRAVFPILRQQVIFTGASEKITAIPLNGVRFEDKKKYKSWFAENTPPLKSYDFRPSYDLFEPVLKIGAAQSDWMQEGEKYLNLLKGVMEPDGGTKKLAKSLTMAAVTSEQKVEDIFRHIQNEYSYNAIEFGLRAMIPQKADKMAKTKYGDCKDHALLLYHLLTAADVPAHLMLVRMEGEVEPALPRLEQFDHMIVYVPGYAKNPFLDATNKNISTNFLADYLRHEKGLVLERGKSRLVEMSPAPEMESRISSDRSVRLKENDVLVSEKVTFAGYSAEDVRAFFRMIPQNEYREKFQDAFSGTSYWIMEEVKVENLMDRSRPFVVELKYRIQNVFYYVGDKLAGALPAFWEEMMLDMTHDPSREVPFQFLYPVSIENRVRWTSSGGFSPDSKEIPSSLNAGGDFFQMNGNGKVLDGGFELTMSTRRKEGIFPAKDYAKAASEIKDILNALRIKIVLSKK